MNWEVQEDISSNVPSGWVRGMPGFGPSLPLSPWFADHLWQGKRRGKGWQLLCGLARAVGLMRSTLGAATDTGVVPVPFVFPWSWLYGLFTARELVSCFRPPGDVFGVESCSADGSWELGSLLLGGISDRGFRWGYPGEIMGKESVVVNCFN